jgi:hypothetical protein
MALVDPRSLTSAEAARRSIERRLHDPSAFRAALLGVPVGERDAWVDLVLGLDGLPIDGPALPAGGVPYLPCSVEVLLRMIDEAPVRSTDVFVDVGAGLGRAITLVHLLTGAGAIGLEIQPELVHAALALSTRLGLSRVRCIEGGLQICREGLTLANVNLTGVLESLVELIVLYACGPAKTRSGFEGTAADGRSFAASWLAGLVRRSSRRSKLSTT